MARKYYVVWEGRQTGIFSDWESCKKQVEKFKGARYKSFPTREEAEAAFGGAKPAAGRKGVGTKPVRKRSSGGGVKTYNAEEVDAHGAEVKIFTDGGCEPNPGEAGSGLALYRGGELSELWYGLYNPMGTNNTAELNALYRALLMAETEIANARGVTIFCDSKYAIQCITQWAAGWEKKGWTKSGGEIKNLELIKEIYALHRALEERVELLHVNGHVGVEGNELADRMSMLAIASKAAEFRPFEESLDIAAILRMQRG